MEACQQADRAAAWHQRRWSVRVGMANSGREADGPNNGHFAAAL